jgi:tRNA (guanine-N7-)-methyltransferase
VNFRPDFLVSITARRAALRSNLALLLPEPRTLVWEIGCGHGHFLVRYATAFPEKFCVGIDLRLERLEKSGRKRDRAGLPNCHFLRAEAREFLNALPPGNTLTEIWALFPDPWPKKRHHKNRLFQAEFLDAVAARTRENAPFYFRTDHEEYFHAVEFTLRHLATWRVAPGTPWPMDPLTVFQERAWQHHSLVAVRTSHPAKPTEIVAPHLPPLRETT